jgi:predicted Zn-dependent protease
MKIKTIIKLVMVALIFHGPVTAIDSRDSIYIEAMQEEVQRGLDGLILDRMLPPGFISYHIVDANTIHIASVLGGVVRSQERRIVKFDNRLLILKDGVSNENFLDLDNMGSWSRYENNIPVTGSKDDVRRALWLVTDDNYKNALTNYESKISAIRQQSLSHADRELPDFLPATKEEIIVPYHSMNIDKERLEDLARSISAVFSGFGNIISSAVNIYVYDGEVFYYNSEGTLARYPFQVAAVVTAASAQTPSGEVLFDHSIHFSKDISDIPSREVLVSEARKVAIYLDDLATTAPIEEPYFGPVLMEGQAVAEIFSRVLFGNEDGLIALRKPVIGDEQIIRYASDWIKENSLEARMGRRIMSRDISIDALPQLETYGEENLLGNFMVDAEGLSSMQRVNLVENGVLKSLLSSRIPTLRVQESNAHARLALSQASVATVTAPGVVKMSVDSDASYDVQDLKKMLISMAREEGLDYAYIVRKVFSPSARLSLDDDLITAGQVRQKSDLSKALQAYRVYVEDGREEPVSLAAIKDLGIRSFRRVLGASHDMQVYNTMFTPANTPLYGSVFGLTGTPVSYIVPRAILFEELDLVRETQQFVRKVPVVENPARH